MEMRYFAKVDDLSFFLGKAPSLIVMSKSFAKSTIGKEVTLKLASDNCFIFSNNLPTIEKIKETLPLTANIDIKAISAFGGGATIDFAKSLMAYILLKNLVPNAQILTVEEINLALNDSKLQSLIDFTVIPTLAGSGSEVTRYATIWSSEVNLNESPKSSISSPLLCPQRVFHVEGISLSASKNSRISGAFDALGHCIESYFSRNSNKQSRGFALQGITVALNCFGANLQEWDSLAHESDLFSLSTLGGHAINITKTNLCHSLSYPLTAKFGISHGFAVAASLVVYLRFAKRLSWETFAQLEHDLGIWNLEEIVDEVVERYGVRTRVQEACGSASSLFSIRKAMFNSGRSNTCIFETSYDEFIDAVGAHLFHS